MKFIAERSAILPALVRAARAANPKSTMSTLGLVQLVVKDGKVRISATDLQLATTTELGVVALHDGHWGVSAKGLLERVRSMPETALTFSADGPPGAGAPRGESLKITAPRTQRSYTMHALPGIDLPPIDSAPKKLDYKYAVPLVLPHLRMVARAMSDDGSRAHVHCTWLELSSSFRAYATDGHRAHVSGPPSAGECESMCLPKAAAVQLAALLEDNPEGTLEIRSSSTLMHFGVGDVGLAVRRVEASRPAYEQIVPVIRCATTIQIDRLALLAAVRSVLVVAPLVSLLARTDGELHLKSEDGKDEGESTDSVRCSFEGLEFEGRVGVRCSYLEEVLQSFTTESVTIGFGGDIDPLKFTAPNELAVLMPTRV